jgi:hypothetical protein
MIVDRTNVATACAPADDDGHMISDATARSREARCRANARPRCTKCGRFDTGPGGAGFGDGHWYCDDCAVRLDLERGDGSEQ